MPVWYRALQYFFLLNEPSVGFFIIHGLQRQRNAHVKITKVKGPFSKSSEPRNDKKEIASHYVLFFFTSRR